MGRQLQRYEKIRQIRRAIMGPKGCSHLCVRIIFCNILAYMNGSYSPSFVCDYRVYHENHYTEY